MLEVDLYWLGLAIWELYIGKTPFENEDVDDIWGGVSQGNTVDVNEIEDEAVSRLLSSFSAVAVRIYIMAFI